MKCHYASQKQPALCFSNTTGANIKLKSVMENEMKSAKEESQCQLLKTLPCSEDQNSCKTDPGPVHNKENVKAASFKECTNEPSLLDGTLEESGYLSYTDSQNSIIFDLETHDAYSEQSEIQDNFHVPAELDNSTEKQTRAISSNMGSLPCVQFAHAACTELMSTHRKCNKFDWTCVDRIADKFNLRNIIGRNIGLDDVDILKELLQRGMKHLLGKILMLLDGEDLIQCVLVSRTWKKIILGDKCTAERYSVAVDKLEKYTLNGMEEFTRAVDGCSREILSCMQVLASTPVSSTPRKMEQIGKLDSQCSKFNSFCQTASTLKHGEGLKACRRCGFPAKFDSCLQRATCTRSSCGCDLCTKCFREYHPSSNCTTGKSTKPVILAGSKKSKSNLKRL
uniref:F-box protein 5 n=1 Tax=Erpetoichthys calabaricus TaxID=27687 RepID=A0A8C4RJ64_ERPCA